MVIQRYCLAEHCRWQLVTRAKVNRLHKAELLKFSRSIHNSLDSKNSEAIVVAGWRHLIGSEGTSKYECN